MNVTDEMVQVAACVYLNRSHDCILPSGNLTDMRKEQEAAMQAAWISVDDKLPKAYSNRATYSLPFLVVSKSFVAPKACFPITRITDFNTDTGIWSGYDGKKSEVTHWMPLPEYKGD